jgi:predicted small secreted protein
MRNNKSFLLVLGIVLLSLLLAACGSTSSGEAGFPTGKFIKSGEPNHALFFNEDGTFSVMEGSTTLVIGRYSVDGDTYTEESNNFGCLTPMSFKYTFDGTNLIFNYVGNPADDPCSGRRGDFDNQTFILSE